jgi:hypothetical protein
MKRWFPVGALLLLFLVLAFTSALEKGATWDETHYLGVGTHILRTGRQDIPSSLLHPPLGFLLSSAPLFFCRLEKECFVPGPIDDLISGVRRGQCLLRRSEPSGDRLLLLARMPTLLCAAGLGLLVFLVARGLFGDAGGLLALFLFATNPNILAHARLATPDLPLALLAFAAVAAAVPVMRTGGMGRAALAGLLLGLALLCKFAGLVMVPVVGALLLLPVMIDPAERPEGPRFRFAPRRLLPLFVVSGLAGLVFLAGFGFDTGAISRGLRAQELIVGEGFPAYLNGEVRQGGFLTYYLQAFFFKEPLGGLALLGIGLIVFLRRRPGGWVPAAALLLPPLAVFAAFTLFSRVNLGLRYVLPAYPFLIVLAGASGLLVSGGRRLAALVVLPLALWQGIGTLRLHPDYLTAFNLLAGGPSGGHRHLVDSNLDWGQDLPALSRYLEKEGIGEIKLSYFGSDDPARHGIRYEALPSFVLPEDATPCRAIVPGDVVVVSVTNSKEVFVSLGALGKELARQEPVVCIGNTLRVYRYRRADE